MARPESARRLVVNADDLGRSPEINEAVFSAHEHGILTSASLMVTGAAAAAAVAEARSHPRLGIGLHLTLVDGQSVLPRTAIPGLVDAQGSFSNRVVWTGLRYFLRRDLRAALARELQAQLTAFYDTGLPLDHVNGHLNLHLHPTVLDCLLGLSPPAQFRHLRLTRDRFRLNARIAAGRWLYRLSHALIFTLLCRHARPRLRQHRIRHTASVFGLLQNGHMDEDYLLRLLPRLPAGDSELYSHPAPDHARHEFDALVSARVKALIGECRIQLIRYGDL
jgi:hopanoid biosynthesis associated protein HpnK